MYPPPLPLYFCWVVSLCLYAAEIFIVFQWDYLYNNNSFFPCFFLSFCVFCPFVCNCRRDIVIARDCILVFLFTTSRKKIWKYFIRRENGRKNIKIQKTNIFWPHCYNGKRWERKYIYLLWLCWGLERTMLAGTDHDDFSLSFFFFIATTHHTDVTKSPILSTSFPFFCF